MERQVGREGGAGAPGPSDNAAFQHRGRRKLRDGDWRASHEGDAGAHTGSMGLAVNSRGWASRWRSGGQWHVLDVRHEKIRLRSD